MCVSTVRADKNNRVPIAGFDQPSALRASTSTSLGVSAPSAVWAARD
ncbi:hypothetical protein [Nakamurella lactea]|nr:hypothetical protein [Nakamurella lactea]